MTKEERSAAAKSRGDEKKARRARFPPARLDRLLQDSGVVVQLESGDDLWLNIKARGEWSAGKIDTWRERSILLDDPVALGNFIGALVARYNAMVEKMNESAKKSLMLAVETTVYKSPTRPVPVGRETDESH